MTNYQRVILTGTLTTQSNFHIGTGEEGIETDKNNNKNDITFNTLCLDAGGNPYIPASSLRGYLKHIIELHEGKNSSTVNTLFGLARQKKDAEEAGNIGLIRVYDARWSKSQATYQQRLISQTSIDPVSNTAKEHHLLSHAVVPPQSIFNVTIEIDKVSSEHVNILLKALNTFDEKYNGKLGKAKTSGQGRASWTQTDLTVLTHEKFIEWLKDRNNKLLTDFYQNDIHIFETTAYKNNKHKEIKLQLTAQSPLLIVDAPFSTKETNRRKDENKKNNNSVLFEADLFFMKQGNDAIIPGSTLKGWVRARCRKILLTLIYKTAKNKGGGIVSISTDSVNKAVDKQIKQLFGSTEAQGLLHFSDAKIKLDDCDIHQQTFNAIDRFTGGTKDTALYNVEAIWPKKAIPLTLQIPEEALNPWMKLLLLFVLRDAMQGDLVLGWGKSKGYGRLTMSTGQHIDWTNLYPSLNLDPSELKSWQDDLDIIVSVERNIETSKEEVTS